METNLLNLKTIFKDKIKFIELNFFDDINIDFNQKNKIDEHVVLIIHDSYKLSTYKIFNFFTIAIKRDFKILFLQNLELKEDFNKFHIFNELKNFGLSNESFVKKEIIYEIKTIKHNIFSYQDIFKNYNNSLIITNCELLSKKINTSIRNLRNLSGKEFELLEKLQISDANKKDINSYSINNIVVISSISGFRKGETLYIQKKINDKTLEVKSRDNIFKELDISKHSENIEVFKKVKKILDIGEQIIFTKNIQNKDSDIRVKKGTKATIINIKNKEILLKSLTGKTMKINIDETPFLDYNYTILNKIPSTIHIRNKIYLIINTDKPFIPLIQELENIKTKISIYTENVELFKSQLTNLNKLEGKINEPGNNTHTKKNGKEPTRYSYKTNGNGEINQWNLYDFSEYAQRARNGIRRNSIFKRNLTYTQEYAMRFEDFNKTLELLELKKQDNKTSKIEINHILQNVIKLK